MQYYAAATQDSSNFRAQLSRAGAFPHSITIDQWSTLRSRCPPATCNRQGGVRQPHDPSPGVRRPVPIASRTAASMFPLPRACAVHSRPGWGRMPTRARSSRSASQHATIAGSPVVCPSLCRRIASHRCSNSCPASSLITPSRRSRTAKSAARPPCCGSWPSMWRWLSCSPPIHIHKRR